MSTVGPAIRAILGHAHHPWHKPMAFKTADLVADMPRCGLCSATQNDDPYTTIDDYVSYQLVSPLFSE